MNETSREIFARLLVLCAISEAQFKANPEKHYRELAERYVKLKAAVQDAMMILSGADDLDLAAEIAPHLPPNIVEVALTRNRKAYERLRHGG